VADLFLRNTKLTFLLVFVVTVATVALAPEARSRFGTAGFALTVAAGVTAATSLLYILNRKARTEEARAVVEQVRGLTAQVAAEAYASQVIRARFPVDGVPVSGYSMKFTNLLLLINLLDRLKPACVVELGSGLSTVCIAGWFQARRAGRLVSLDHDEGWAEETRYHLGRLGLEEYAEVIFAPLRRQGGSGQEFAWYDLGACPDLPAEIDLLVIDGPPAGQTGLELARLPALEALGGKLAGHAVVVLDDTTRPGERAVIAQWKRRWPGLDVRSHETLSGLCEIRFGAGDDMALQDH
jgi:predicted O-methyltransferase YrrM